jgi:hypothetical protein
VNLPAVSTDLRERLTFWALAGLALLVTHDAIYLAQIGPGESVTAALRTAGHGYWAWASLGLTAVAMIAGTWSLLRIRRLRRRASALGATSIPDRPIARRFASAWLRLGLVVSAGFVLQENVEHLVIHGHGLGAGALFGPEYPLAMPVIGFVSALAAVVAALVARTRDALVSAIVAALRPLARAPRVGPRPPVRLGVLIGSVLARRGAGRAPPTLVASAI